MKILLGKGKGKTKKAAPLKNQSTKGVGGNKHGGGSHSGHGHGHSHSQSNGTSTSTGNNETSNVTASTRGHRQGRSWGQPTNIVTDVYPVPNFKAVVTDDAPPVKKGCTPPDNNLAVLLAKYFKSRTEIEYDVLLKQMEAVPQANIMHLLGIKKKTDDSEEKEDSEKDQSIKEILQLIPEDEKEVDELMATLAPKAKEQEIKEMTMKQRECTKR